MFDRLFVSRNRKVTDLIKLGDYLGRSIRENLQIFSIDDVNKSVTYITGSKHVIRGNYDLDKGIHLKNIQIESGSNFADNDKFEGAINKEVTKFINTIYQESISEANDQFSAILGLWGSRLKFNKSLDSLDERSEAYNRINQILEAEEFSRLKEIEESLIEYLKENKEAISKIPEIKNAVNLSNTVSRAFNTPKITLDELKEQKTYTVQELDEGSIYNVICREELIKKELLESKKSFSNIWVTNEKITTLVSHALDEAVDDTAFALCEAIAEIPYLALATKKQLRTIIENNLSLNTDSAISEKDLKSFVSTLFEVKKPLKTAFLSLLSEKYGINIQTLNTVPSFKSLLNTQVVIFEALAKISEKGSVQKDTLSEVSTVLKGKNGVESLDVNEYVNYLFEKAGYLDLIVKESVSQSVSFTEALTELGSVEEVAEFILEKFKSKDIKTDTQGSDEEGDEEAVLQGDDELDVKEKSSKKKKKKIKEETEEEELEEDVDDEQIVSTEPEAEEEDEEEPEKETEEEELEEEALEDMSQDELMAALTELEELLPDAIDLDTEEEEEE